MSFRRSADTDPEVWYAAAQRIDQVRLANKAFQSMLQSITAIPAYSALSKLISFLVLRPLFHQDSLHLHHLEEYL